MGDVFSDPRSIADFSRYLLFILFFYLNYHVLVPRFFFTKRYFVFTLLVLLTFLVTAELPNLFMGFGPPPKMPDFPEMHRMRPMGPPDNFVLDVGFKLGRHVTLFLLVFIFSLLMRISNRLKETEAARQKAEVAYLQAQVNPHFFFNTLNSLYSLALEKSDQLPDALVTLSNMMRYVLTEANKTKVPLQKEIDYIKSYIELQQLRIAGTAEVKLSFNGTITSQEITPLLLIPFIENAFKYGVNPEEKSAIEIEIDIAENELHMLVKNNKVHISKVDKTGLGIENARQRLQLQYPGAHTLTVHENTEVFSVSLLITL